MVIGFRSHCSHDWGSSQPWSRGWSWEEEQQLGIMVSDLGTSLQSQEASSLFQFAFYLGLFSAGVSQLGSKSFTRHHWLGT